VEPNDVTFIDKAGEELLRAMSREGMQFVAAMCMSSMCLIASEAIRICRE
jgi:hypothetical protein